MAALWLFCVPFTALAQDDPRLADLALPELISVSQERVSEMNEIIQSAFDSLEAARAEEDIPRVNCITEGVTVMRGLMRIAEESLLGLREFVARGDGKAAVHGAVKIHIASQKFGEIDIQVRSCGGPDMKGTVDGRPTVEKIFDADLPVQDPVDALYDVDVHFERPPSASQFY